MRVNLARLAIVLIVIAIGLTLFGGPFVIGAGGWPIIEMWSTQFWSMFFGSLSFSLAGCAWLSKDDTESTKMLKGFLVFQAFTTLLIAVAILFPGLNLWISIAIACTFGTLTAVVQNKIFFGTASLFGK